MIDLISRRVSASQPQHAIEEEHAIKQALQEIALFALWRAGFFETALFQGGTSLRILYGLPRFSEDLDFLLRTPDPDFDWSRYLDSVSKTFADFGLRPEILPRDAMDGTIRRAVLKDTSLAGQLDLVFADHHPAKKLRIKLEVDINPPATSGEALSFLDFPLDFQVRHQDLPSNFALKLHALLCRPYLKGRDWYDFSWYVARGIAPNMQVLQAALLQTGPWSDEAGLMADVVWLGTALDRKIHEIDWKEAGADVRRFLRPIEASSLDLWSIPFFAVKAEKMLTLIRPTEGHETGFTGE